MKTLRLTLAGLALLAAGCINIDQTLDIQKDASGSFDLIYSISEQAVTQIEAMLKLKEQMAMAAGETAPATDEDRHVSLLLSPTEDQIRREIKKYAEYGITVESLTVESKNAWRHVQLKVLFKNLADVAQTDFFPQYGFSLSRNSNGDYVFFRANENKDYSTSMDLIDPETVSLLMPILAGFKIHTKINTPGRILKTNAHRKSLYSAVWSFDVDSDPDSLCALQNQDMKIVFDGEGLDLPEISVRTSSAGAPTDKPAL